MIEETDLVWQGQEEVLVTGIPPGTRMVISDLPAPVEGMKVRVSAP